MQSTRASLQQSCGYSTKSLWPLLYLNKQKETRRRVCKHVLLSHSLAGLDVCRSGIWHLHAQREETPEHCAPRALLGASSSFLHGNTERPRAEVRLSAAKRRLKDPQDLQHSYWLDIHSRLMGKAYSQEPVSSKTLYLHEKLPVGGFQSQTPISGILGHIRLITVSH